MNYKNILAVAVLVAVIGVFSLLQTKPWAVFGSVEPGGEYVATTTDATWSIAVNQCKPLLTQGKTIGSVIVTKTSNATLTITDATSTIHTDFATSTIASFPLTTVGTYTFDVNVQRGICVQVDTTVGVASTTITFR